MWFHPEFDFKSICSSSVHKQSYMALTLCAGVPPLPTEHLAARVLRSAVSWEYTFVTPRAHAQQGVGVLGDLWLWIREYLSMRFQCVCIGECRSELLPVVSGVPQGSILGPLLFLVFVNDLPEVVKHSLLYMFADDTKCAKLVRHLSDCCELQNDNLCNWSYEWKLMFKEPKCVLLRCSRSGGTPVNSNYTLNDQDPGSLQGQPQRSWCDDILKPIF